jgi:hypothetical protein
LNGYVPTKSGTDAPKLIAVLESQHWSAGLAVYGNPRPPSVRAVVHNYNATHYDHPPDSRRDFRGLIVAQAGIAVSSSARPSNQNPPGGVIRAGLFDRRRGSGGSGAPIVAGKPNLARISRVDL